MKVKIELQPGEHVHDADEVLEKALSAKRDCSNEKYLDKFLNDFHEYVCASHLGLVDRIVSEISQEVEQNAHQKRSV